MNSGSTFSGLDAEDSKDNELMNMLEGMEEEDTEEVKTKAKAPKKATKAASNKASKKTEAAEKAAEKTSEKTTEKISKKRKGGDEAAEKEDKPKKVKKPQKPRRPFIKCETPDLMTRRNDLRNKLRIQKAQMVLAENKLFKYEFELKERGVSLEEEKEEIQEDCSK